MDSSCDVTKSNFLMYTGVGKEVKQVGFVLLHTDKTGRLAEFSKSSYSSRVRDSIQGK